MIKYVDFRLDCSTNAQYNSKIITKKTAEADPTAETLQSQKTPSKRCPIPGQAARAEVKPIAMWRNSQFFREQSEERANGIIGERFTADFTDH